MDNIKIFKLKSSEEVIGEDLGVANGEYHIKNPLVIIVVPPQQMGGKQQLAFVPYVQFSKDELFKLDVDHIACVCEPLEQILQNYKQTFSQLTLPSKSLILPT